MQDFICLDGVSFSYREKNPPVPALKNISLSIGKGEYIAVLGHNGSGKSTLAKLLNMMIKPEAGKIMIQGIDITNEDMTEDDMFDIRRSVGMVFQNPDNQLVATVVEEDVAFGPENLGVERSELRERVDEALAQVGMTAYARHSPHHLSGGQKQRVAIAGIIAMRPDCIILDESTAMLDPQGRKEVLETVEMLHREKGITVIHITHYMEEAARANRVIVINDGSLLFDGAPSFVFSHVDALKEVGLMVPQGTELLHLLAKKGYRVPQDVITTEECVKVILACQQQENNQTERE